jgi:DNA-binding MarR family transcriptional regulator
MTTRLQDEIRQTKPFASLEEEAYLSLERTTAVLRHHLAESLKAYGITGTQLNVLRILRGAQPVGLCRNEIGDRLVAQVPDVTRLLDRMQDAGLVVRERSAEDRRLVRTRITGDGLALLARLDQPLLDLHRQQLGHLSPDELRALIDLLGVVRSRD